MSRQSVIIKSILTLKKKHIVTSEVQTATATITEYYWQESIKKTNEKIGQINIKHKNNGIRGNHI